MIKFVESKVAPNPKECTYWVDIKEDPYFGSIKKYDGKKWVNIINDSNQDAAIEEIKNQLKNKVDKVSGKQLSTNDYTTPEKEKLASLSNYNDAAIKKSIEGKVDKVEGKQLSTNDYTTDEKNKLAGIAAQANKTTVENVLTSTSTTNALSAAQGKVLKEALDALSARVSKLETPAA